MIRVNRVGYHYFNFDGQFKKLRGVSPQKFRKNLLMKLKDIDISGLRADNSIE